MLISSPTETIHSPKMIWKYKRASEHRFHKLVDIALIWIEYEAARKKTIKCESQCLSELPSNCYRLVKSAATSFSETWRVSLPPPLGDHHLGATSALPPSETLTAHRQCNFSAWFIAAVFVTLPHANCITYTYVPSLQWLSCRCCQWCGRLIRHWDSFLSANSDELGHVFSCAEPTWRDLALFFLLSTSQMSENIVEQIWLRSKFYFLHIYWPCSNHIDNLYLANMLWWNLLRWWFRDKTCLLMFLWHTHKSHQTNLIDGTAITFRSFRSQMLRSKASEDYWMV